MNTLTQHMFKAGFILGAFAVVTTALVAVSHFGTRDRIEEASREALRRSLEELVPASLYDNRFEEDTLTVSDENSLGTPNPVTVYRARKQGRPVAAVFTAVAPDGYSGNISLLMAVDHTGKVLGVRVLAHKETPGLGDPIELRRSPWIKSFDGRSLDKPAPEGWKVKKDGGVFDQFTGATITPRAVVKAVRKGLEYFQTHRDALFAAPPAKTTHP